MNTFATTCSDIVSSLINSTGYFAVNLSSEKSSFSLDSEILLFANLKLVMKCKYTYSEQFFNVYAKYLDKFRFQISNSHTSEQKVLKLRYSVELFV